MSASRINLGLVKGADGQDGQDGQDGKDGKDGMLDSSQLAALNANFDLISECDQEVVVAETSFSPQNGWTLYTENGSAVAPTWHILPGGVYLLTADFIGPSGGVAQNTSSKIGTITSPQGYRRGMGGGNVDDLGNVISIPATGEIIYRACNQALPASTHTAIRLIGAFQGWGNSLHGKFATIGAEAEGEEEIEP